MAKTLTTISAVPTGLKATPKSYSSIDLNWNTYAGASGYNIYGSTSPDEPFGYCTSIRNTSFTDTGIKEKTHIITELQHIPGTEIRRQQPVIDLLWPRQPPSLNQRLQLKHRPMLKSLLSR